MNRLRASPLRAHVKIVQSFSVLGWSAIRTAALLFVALHAVAMLGACGGAGGVSDTGGGPGAGGAVGAGSSGSSGSGASLGAGGSGSSDSGSGAASGSGSGGADSGAGGSAHEPVTCPTFALPSGDTTRTVTVGGESRTYVLHVPEAYMGDAAVPLIVDFHPLNGSGPAERTASPYPAVVDGEGVITAFPSGKTGPGGNAWNVGACCVADFDDVAFARALVDDVASVACIEPSRVYAVGFSMGGGMSHYLACHAADLFAAVAPAAFDLLEENVEGCEPSRPISVVSFRGTNDPVVPYEGGYSSVVSGMPINFLGAEDTFAAWAEMNGCTSGPSAKDSNGCQAYSGCEGDVDVVLCTKSGGGHEYGVATIAWPILSAHQLP